MKIIISLYLFVSLSIDKAKKTNVMKTNKLVFALLLIGVSITITSCAKRKNEKELSGSYERTAEQVTYTDSTKQVLLEAWNISFDRKGEKMRWGGSVVGECSCTFEKSSRDPKNELELKLKNPDFKTMLPNDYEWNGTDYVNTNQPDDALYNAKFYARVDEKTLRITVVIDGAEQLLVYNKL